MPAPSHRRRGGSGSPQPLREINTVTELNNRLGIHLVVLRILGWWLRNAFLRRLLEVRPPRLSRVGLGRGHRREQLARRDALDGLGHGRHGCGRRRDVVAGLEPPPARTSTGESRRAGASMASRRTHAIDATRRRSNGTRNTHMATSSLASSARARRSASLLALSSSASAACASLSRAAASPSNAEETSSRTFKSDSVASSRFRSRAARRSNARTSAFKSTTRASAAASTTPPALAANLCS